MSGGVDSSVAAAILKEKGFDVVGITMCFNISFPNSRKPSCCGAEGINDAKRAAEILDIPHYVLNFAKDLDKYIIKNFVDEYQKGRTPNPCVRCNQLLKFNILFKKARSLGADYVATGHYAKISYSASKKCYEMKKARDPKKDQTYFLYGTDKKILPFLLFPLGKFTKDEVRDLAKKYKLNTASKPESQDICFVPESGYKKFIQDKIGKKAITPGPFKNEIGEVVGEHKGIIHYTIGQRDGLGLAMGYPVYVYKIDRKSNTVYVGPTDCLKSQGLYAGQLNFISGEIPKDTIEVGARIRYNAKEVKGYLTCLEKGRIRLEFKNPQKSVTPGQSVVFYRRNTLLGGAVIDKAISSDEDI